MRLAVFSAKLTPKWVIYSVLDRLHGENGLHIIAWVDNWGGSCAVDWAKTRPGAEIQEVSNVKAFDTRWKGQYFDKRAAVESIFKLYQPERAIVFSSPYWIASGTGKTILSKAEKWGVPVHFYEPTRHDTDKEGRKDVWKEPIEPRIVELCGKVSPMGKTVCSRLKGHPSAWHWAINKGEIRSKFWLP